MERRISIVFAKIVAIELVEMEIIKFCPESKSELRKGYQRMQMSSAWGY